MVVTDAFGVNIYQLLNIRQITLSLIEIDRSGFYIYPSFLQKVKALKAGVAFCRKIESHERNNPEPCIFASRQKAISQSPLPSIYAYQCNIQIHYGRKNHFQWVLVQAVIDRAPYGTHCGHVNRYYNFFSATLAPALLSLLLSSQLVPAASADAPQVQAQIPYLFLMKMNNAS